MDYLKLIRIYQWIKNTFVFLPIFFAGRMLEDGDSLLRLIVIFFAFSFTASGIYILNDYIDRESDRQHPDKNNRPLASGRVGTTEAFLIMAFLIPAGLILGFALGLQAGLIVSGYFVMNVLYSIRLKHVPILDITLIAIGFLLRVYAGGVVADVVLSRWIIIMTFLLALFMGIAKRRDDVLIFHASGNKVRKSVDGYNLDFINISLGLMAAVIIVAYIMYTLSDDALRSINQPNIYMTTLFVIVGILRYLQITMVENKSGSPTKILLKDRFVQITVAAWIIAYYIFIYQTE